MRISRLGGAPTKGKISSLGSRATERVESKQLGAPRRENRQDVGIKEGKRGWHNGRKA